MIQIKNKKITNLLTGIIVLIRVPLAILGMICVLIGGVIGGFEYFNQDLVLAMIAVFFITSGSMAFNDYFDKDIDKKVHPNRPIPSGKITPLKGLTLSIIFFIIGLFISLLINTLCFFIAIITIDLLVLYEIKFKNQGIVGNLVVSFIVAISFSFGGASVNRLEMSIVFTLLAFFLILGREILMDVTDIEGDKIIRYTLPMRIGKIKATYLGCLSLSISAFFLLIPGIIGIFPNYYMIIILPVQALLLYSIVLPLIDIKNTSRSADLLLFTMAIGLPIFIFNIIF